MSVNILDTILHTIITILNGGFVGLIPIGLGILGVLAVLELRLGFLYATLDGYVDWVKLFGLAFMPLLMFAVLAYLIQSAATWTNEALQMFLHWGSQVANVNLGGTPLTSALSSPTSLWELGFQLAFPLYQFITSPWNQLTGSTVVLMTYWASYIATVVFFGLMALHVMMALIEFKVAGLMAVPFLAWGALSQARFLMWGALAYIAAVGARLFVLTMLLSAALVAIFTWAPLQTTAAADVTWTQAIVLGFGSLTMFVITWTLPSLAAGRIAGGGGGVGARRAVGRRHGGHDDDSRRQSGGAGRLASRALGGAVEIFVVLFLIICAAEGAVIIMQLQAIVSWTRRRDGQQRPD